MYPVDTRQTGCMIHWSVHPDHPSHSMMGWLSVFEVIGLGLLFDMFMQGTATLLLDRIDCAVCMT